MLSRFIIAMIAAGCSMLSPSATRAAVTPAAATKCAIPQPCSTFTNTGAGPGLEAVGSGGEAGLAVSSGGAGFIGLSGSGSFLDAGIDGESYDASGNDAGGVFGADYFANGVAPTYGVVGVGAPYGLLGLGVPSSSSSTAYGVLGQDNYGTASSAGDYNVGTGGQSVAGTAVLGTSNGNPVISVFGRAPVGVYAVANTATGTPNANAFAFFGETNSFGLDLHQTVNNATVYLIDSAYLIDATAANLKGFTVDYSGNGSFSGTVTTSKGTYVRTTGASGATMMEYAHRDTAPEVEDVGEGQLANGRAYVSIDARFGDTIDRRVSYHVFVTPEGDCNQLYVTQKSAAGFEVRESHGGRATLAFDYRIVAKPLDENGARLAAAPALAKHVDDGMKAGSARAFVAPPLSPLERLKRRLGTQKYAETMLNFRAKRQAFVR